MGKTKTFALASHVIHGNNNDAYFGYAPYVREMNIWFKHIDKAIVVAPLKKIEKSPIDLDYETEQLDFVNIPAIQFTSLAFVLKSVFKVPLVIFKLWIAFYKADHIHLRCPGNIGLLGCFVQILFPSKLKTAKYAGNWDPKAKQPFSYKLQKWLLSNAFLTRNMTVLVYGEWKNQSKNILPFFTASYSENERIKFFERDYSHALKMLFIGSLVPGKRPHLALDIIKGLKHKGINVSLDFYGDGVLRTELEKYAVNLNITDAVCFKGNRTKDELKHAYQNAHFTLLPSKSEGWPKALAEAMFYGCVPISTAVSCVPFMLDFGKRGILISPEKSSAITSIAEALEIPANLVTMGKAAQNWSQMYTIEKFEQDIKQLLE